MVIAFEPKDFPVPDIDRGNDTFELAFQQVAHHGKADRRGFIRGADNGNRAGLKQLFELLAHD